MGGFRDISGNRKDIEQAMKNLEQDGFINYFGMQRFGTNSIGTHAIGRTIRQCEWEKAVDLILRPREGGKRGGH
jgi:tRNA pseudouridine13 synthase